jgi:hypothetical protein
MSACRNGAACTNVHCTRTHHIVTFANAPYMEPCHFGAACTNTNCSRTHPPERPATCPLGEGCPHRGVTCRLLHPAASKPCRFDAECTNARCTRFHPSRAHPAAPRHVHAPYNSGLQPRMTTTFPVANTAAPQSSHGTWRHPGNPVARAPPSTAPFFTEATAQWSDPGRAQQMSQTAPPFFGGAASRQPAPNQSRGVASPFNASDWRDSSARDARPTSAFFSAGAARHDPPAASEWSTWSPPPVSCMLCTECIIQACRHAACSNAAPPYRCDAPPCTHSCARTQP